MAGQIHSTWDRNEYEQFDGLNQSTIKIAYDRSLYHAREKLTHPSASTDVQIIGQALHTLILEPAMFDRRFAPMPVNEKGDRWNRRMKEGARLWEEFDEQHADKYPIKPAKIAELREIREQVLRHADARKMIESCELFEMSFVWEHPQYDFSCKGQTDILTEYDGWTWCVDLKTTIDASERGFRRAVANYGYMVQAVWYLEGLNEITQGDRRFAFIAIEKDPPYAVMVHELDAELMFEGRFRCDTISQRWDHALETGRFESYPGGINTLTGPKWAMTHEYAMEAGNEAGANLA